MLHVLGSSGFIGARVLSVVREWELPVGGPAHDRADLSLTFDLGRPADFGYGTVGSGDTVYGETEEPRWEETPPNPFGPYAESKAEVEETCAGKPAFPTLRLSYVFARTDGFTGYFLGCVERGEQAEVSDTLFRRVVRREDPVAAILALAGRGDGPPST